MKERKKERKCIQEVYRRRCVYAARPYSNYLSIEKRIKMMSSCCVEVIHSFSFSYIQNKFKKKMQICATCVENLNIKMNMFAKSLWCGLM